MNNTYHKNLLRSLVILKNKGVDFTCLLIGTGMCKNNLKLVEDSDLQY